MNLRNTILTAVAGAVLTALVAMGFQGKAVDTAGDPLTVPAAISLREAGVTLFVQALTWWPRCSLPASKPWTAVPSLTIAREAGLGIAAYFLVDSTLSGQEAVALARSGIPDDIWDALVFVAIDFEIPGECYSAGVRIPLKTIQDAADALVALGKPCVIYTSYGEWGSRMTPKNAPHPVGCYLWEASWDQNPDVDFNRHPFGGWTEADVVMEQYNGGSAMSGVYVDLDSMSLSPFPWLILPSTPEWCCDTNYWGPVMGTSRYHPVDDSWYWGIPQADGRTFLYRWHLTGPWVCIAGCP